MPQPTTKHHADWLSLLEISGPFLSMPVLTNAFPQGLDELDEGQARSLRADYEFWQENVNDPAVHTAWIKLVLESLLGYSPEVLVTGQAISAGWKAEFPEHDETIRPDFMLVEPDPSPGPSPDEEHVRRGGKAPHLLIQVYPPSQALDKPVQGSKWQASAATRMMELLHATEVRLGLLTNGEQWMLVDAPRGETSGFISWYAELWFDEPVTLRAFKSLLGVQRFFGVAADQTLESLLKASANDQQEITDQLGLQVRHAVEILIQMIDRADQDSGGKLLGGATEQIQPSLLYEAALTVMMRLVFMLSAEERKLLPLDEPLYAENYAVSTLYAQLSVTEEEVLERRFDAWSRLLAVFRAVHGGIRHERLNLLPYGGSLFDPDKYPFLEGRVNGTRTSADGRGDFKEKDLIRVTPRNSASKTEIPLPVNNRTVLHLLKALQILQVAERGEARRISFRALDVEQIGHVYEGLLDHHAVRASELVLGLRGAKRIEPEIGLSELEKAAGGKESDFTAWLNACTGRSLSALKNALASDILEKDAQFSNRLRAACGNDEALFARVKPFAGLLRADDFDAPVVIQAGSVYVTAGTTRRATGTHYTPRSLTEPVVQHTLEPLVYAGPAEGLPRTEWKLRSPSELLDLKICDMAMGSGGFLVQVVRYMAERLVEAMMNDECRMQNGRSKAEGENSAFSILHSALTAEDKLTYAKRLIAERCIYGVDKNPLAVEIAKLSLWLVTLDKNKPFSFLDHALKCGDSLVGCSEDDFLRWAHGYKAAGMTLFDEQIRAQLETAREKRRALENFLSDNTQALEQKAAMLREAEAAMAHIRRGADLLTGSRLLGLKAQEVEDLQINLLFPYMAGELDGLIDAAKHPDAAKTLHTAQKERAFHWEFAFPEVFEKGGFNALVGNPPFIGGQFITVNFGRGYSSYLKERWSHAKGSADICAYFFLTAYEKLRSKGNFGFISTNTISQGDTRELGLDFISQNRGVIYSAISSTKWPGTAAVYVSIINITKQEDYSGVRTLNGKYVSIISPVLDDVEFSKPNRLSHSGCQSFQGSIVLGQGFVLEPKDAKELIKNNPKNSEVIFPYLSGEDLSSRFDQTPSRWVINFFDWSLEHAEKYVDCMKIVREKVYPERIKNNEKQRREFWWRFTRPTVDLYTAIKDLKRVICKTRHSPVFAFSFVNPKVVFQESLVVFASEQLAHFAVLSSTFHEYWSWKYGSTLGENTLRYSPTDCFETFPFPGKNTGAKQPKDLTGLEQIGESYHETRREIMLARQEGLTKIYNRFHDPNERGADIVELRRLHVEMDQAVASAYGWGNAEVRMQNDELEAENSSFSIPHSSLELGHDFHETAQGIRFTISESARREVLSRLLKLNHERWEQEQGEVDKLTSKKENRKTGKSKNARSDEGQLGMF